MDKHAPIYVAGEHTLIGAAIRRALERHGFCNLVRSGEQEPAWSCPDQVDAFFAATRPQIVYLAAGKSGGIGANQKFPADLMLDNLLAECYLIQSAYRHGVTKLLYLASSCIYPKQCPQPMREDALLTGPLEPTNEAYAMAKIAGLTLCQAYRQQHGANFICGIPANVYGPGDQFDAENAHVISALIRKMHDAKREGLPSVEVWGTGAAQREFIYGDDLAEACLFVMDAYDGPEPLNLGSGKVVSIRALACLIRETVGYTGDLRFNAAKPNGFARKVLDSSRLEQLGWRCRPRLSESLAETYRWFLSQQKEQG